jgi:hypothetical protein
VGLRPLHEPMSKRRRVREEEKREEGDTEETKEGWACISFPFISFPSSFSLKSTMIERGTGVIYLFSHHL